MNHIKPYHLFEAVVEPFNFKEVLSIIKNGNFSDIEELNKNIKEYQVEFITFEEFKNSLGTDIEKKVAPEYSMMGGGIKFGVFNKYRNMIEIVVEPHMFNYMLKVRMNDMFLEFIDQILQHESIHLQQVSKMKNKDAYILDSSPEFDADKYNSEKREIMAYAQTIILELKNKRFTKNDIINQLKKGKLESEQFEHYKKLLNEKDMKRFMKYLYQYAENLK